MSTSVNVPPPDAMMAPVQGSGKPTKPYAPKNNPPSQTLYVNNLNEKLKKEGTSLNACFDREVLLCILLCCEVKLI